MPPRRQVTNESEETPAKKSNVTKTPVLPWMRVPITIQQGSGVPLAQVKGLGHQLATALQSSTNMSIWKGTCYGGGLRGIAVKFYIASPLLPPRARVPGALPCPSCSVEGACRRPQLRSRPLHRRSDGIWKDPCLCPAHHQWALQVRISLL